jgi:hypothetical protein
MYAYGLMSVFLVVGALDTLCHIHIIGVLSVSTDDTRTVLTALRAFVRRELQLHFP